MYLVNNNSFLERRGFLISKKVHRYTEERRSPLQTRYVQSVFSANFLNSKPKERNITNVFAQKNHYIVIQ